MVGPLEDRREQLAELCRAFRVKRLDVFGSAAERERVDPNESDFDLLLEFEPMDPAGHAKACEAVGQFIAGRTLADCD